MLSSPPKKRETGALKEVWQAYNALLEYTRSISVMQSGNRGVRVSRTSNGTLLAVDSVAEAATATTVQSFIISSDGPDEWVATTGERIAKPWTLRRTPFDGQTLEYIDERNQTYSITFSYISSFKRSVLVSGSTENQVIIPRFKLGRDVIFAIKIEDTGVAAAPEWLDLNVDARQWAKE